jgi:DNA damage-inducible protein 1
MVVCPCGQTNVPLQRQQLHFNGKEIQNAEKLSAIGVKDGDLVMMLPLSDTITRCVCWPS